MTGPFVTENSFDFAAPIWEMQAWQHLLLITTKDQDQLATRFSLLDTQKNQLIFEEIGFEEEWWISIFLFNGKQVLFQVYDDTQDIEQRSVFCLEIESMEVLWAVDGVRLQQVNPFTIKINGGASTDESSLIEVASGTEVKEPVEFKTPERNQIDPQVFNTESEHYSLLVNFLEARGIKVPIGGLEYLEYAGLIFIAANFKSKDTYSLQLFVYDEEGESLANILLENEMSGLGVGAFFILDQALIFVKEKYQLKICSLG